MVQWSRWWKYCSLARHHTNLKNTIQTGFVWWLPIVSSKYRYLYQLCYVKVFSTNHNRNLVLLDDPGHVWSQITSVVCQIQRFDFDCNLVVTRKLIIRIPAGLGLNPLYEYVRGISSIEMWPRAHKKTCVLWPWPRALAEKKYLCPDPESWCKRQVCSRASKWAIERGSY